MSILISLSPAAEIAMTDQARARGRELNEYVSEVVERVATWGVEEHPRVKQGTPEWFAVFQEWLDSHEPVGHFVDDSRETI